jgi:hypothetical protein
MAGFAAGHPRPGNDAGESPVCRHAAAVYDRPALIPQACRDDAGTASLRTTLPVRAFDMIQTARPETILENKRTPP